MDNLFTGSNSFYQPVPDAIKPLRFSPKPDNRPASLLSTPTSKPVYTIVASQPLQTSSNQKIQIDPSFVQTASLLVGDGKGFSEKLWIYIYLFQLVVVVFRVFCCNHTQWGRNRWEPELRYSPKFENRTNFYAIFGKKFLSYSPKISKKKLVTPLDKIRSALTDYHTNKFCNL